MVFIKMYLLCIFLFSYAVQIQGLDFSINKTPESEFCGLLNCLVNVGQSYSTIFSIVGMTIYDITQASNKAKIASVTVSVSTPELYVDPALTDFMNASGTVSRYHAELSLSLKRDSDCNTASFHCELDFMNLQGQLDKQEKTLTPQTGECPGDLAQTAADLASRTKQLEDELSSLNGRYQQLEAKLNIVLGEHTSTLPTDGPLTAGLDFSITKTPESEFCGLLNCLVNVGQGDSTIFSIVGMTIYDITQASNKAKIASVTVSVSTPELYVDPALTDFMNASGTVSRYHAELSLSLKRDSDCNTASFHCELDFMNLQGQLDKQEKTLTPQTGECPGDLAQTAADLASRTKQLEDELSSLNGRYQQLEAKLNSVLGEHTSTLPTDGPVTAGTSEPTTTSTQTPPTTSTQKAPTTSTQKPLTTSTQKPLTASTQKASTTQPHTNPGSRRGCAPGMSLDQPREKFTLPGNIPALCDTETDGGAWVIIQRRTKGDVDFYKNWSDYKRGFGTPDTDFWLGNDVIHSLTSQGYTELRVDLELQDKTGFAHYSTFSVGDEGSKYKLTVGGYSGTAGDNLAYHNGMAFTTFDQDNDANQAFNCAEDYHGAWWYKECYDSNLNGEWGVDSGNALMWNDFVIGKGVSFSEMKIRHV